MITSSVVMSFIFFLVALCTLYLGIYLVYMDISSQLNKLFFAASIALGIWAVGSCIAIVASNVETVLLWRRVAALGWGSIYCIILHFVIVLISSNKFSQYSRDWCLIKRYRYIVLYLPAILTLYAFSVSSDLAEKQYDFILTNFGWRNIATDTYWNIFFNIYYISYCVLSIFLLIRWSRKIVLIREKKQANLIIYSVTASFIIGSITDNLLDYYPATDLPEIGVLLIFISLTTIWYAIKRYSIMTLSPSFIAEDILKNMNDGLILLDEGGFIQMLNPSASDLLDDRHQELIGTNISSILKGNQVLNSSFTGQEKVIITKDQTEKPVLFSAAPIVDNWGGMLGVVCILSDLSEIKKKEEALKKTQEELERRVYKRTVALSDINKLLKNEAQERNILMKLQQQVSEISAEFISINQRNMDNKILDLLSKIGVVLKADRAYFINHDDTSKRANSFYEWYKSGIIPRVDKIKYVDLINDLWHSDLILHKDNIFVANIDELLQNIKNKNIELEKLQIKSILVIPLKINQQIIGFIIFDSVYSPKKWNNNQISIMKLLANILSDGLSKIATEKEIEFLAYYDYLTQLPNRLLLSKKLDEYITDKKYDQLCLIFLDLDGFKMINDTVGHHGGDFLLKEVSKALKNIIGTSGMVSRISGDEFIIVIHDFKEEEEIIPVANQLLEIFKTPFSIENEELFITGSAGISFYPIDGVNTDELIKNADSAMYLAKENGKNQYQFCTSTLKTDLSKKISIIKSLQHAIIKDELILYYQPQVCLKTEKILSVEALIRWNSPELGMVSPAVFIPLAEQNGLINAIGEWVLRTACKQNRIWQDKGLDPIKIGVNLSIHQFKHSNLLEQLESILKEFKIEPQYLELEITESIAMDQTNNVIDTLKRLKALGVHIAIDDFGTKYSSLSRIKQLPIDKIKIDKEFIWGLSDNSKDQAITKTIILLGKSLDIKLIAEGAQTKEQIDFLKAMECDEVQGYYYYKPMPAEELESILVL